MRASRSTFPLDELAISRQVLRQIITDPISWIPLLPPVGLYTFFQVPGWLPLALGGGIVAGLGVFWKTQWNALADKQRQFAIREHNAAQDQELANAAQQFANQGQAEHARWMNRFLRLKQKIETRIHEDSQMTSQKIQIERLIDALCFEARDQLALLIKSQSNDFSAISTAFDTLESAGAQIEGLLGPGDTLPGQSTNLEEITNRLREETEIARRIQERLRNPPTTEFVSPPPENLQSQ